MFDQADEQTSLFNREVTVVASKTPRMSQDEAWANGGASLSKLCKGLPSPKDVILKPVRNPSEDILERLSQKSKTTEHVKHSGVEKHVFTLPLRNLGPFRNAFLFKRKSELFFI